MRSTPPPPFLCSASPASRSVPAHTHGPLPQAPAACHLPIVPHPSTLQWALDHSNTRFDQLQPLTSAFGPGELPVWQPNIYTQQAPPAMGGGWLVKVTLGAAETQQLREALPVLG